MKRQVLIIGLGRFGSSLAVSLENMGGEVMVVDKRESAVSEIADSVTHSLIADTTDERVVKDLGVEQFDEVVCAIGGDIEASLMTTMLLLEFGAKQLVSKASTDLHGRLLKSIGVKRIVYPERDVSEKLAREFLAPPGLEELMALDITHKMFEIKAPAAFGGKSLKDLHLRARFGMNVVAIRRLSTNERGEDVAEVNVTLNAADVIESGDGLIVVGDEKKVKDALRDMNALKG